MNQRLRIIRFRRVKHENAPHREKCFLWHGLCLMLCRKDLYFLLHEEKVVVDALIHSGSLASFCIGDAMSPDAMASIRFAGPELTVRGRVTYLSDSGQRKNHFAIVEVNGMSSPVVVPVACLQLEDEQPAGGALSQLRLIRDRDRPYEVARRLDQG